MAPDATETGTLGTITLHPHQVSAVQFVRSALAEFGGAIVADAPGLGKTFVALAVAAAFRRCVVAAPASLRTMWADAASRAGVPISFISLEAISRGAVLPPRPEFVVVDEAHRVASPSARRYGRVAALAHHAHLLLLTATPVRNRRAELTALLALFLGPDARGADDALISRCVLRRECLPELELPQVVEARPLRPRGGKQIATALRTLPPPLAVAGGTPAAALVTTVLARCWASSLAALDAALVRRLQRGAAIRAALAEGRLPSRIELLSWVVGDDAMQLAFPFVASAMPLAAPAEAGGALARHCAAIEAVRAGIRPGVSRDTAWRAQFLLAICERHDAATVIAFTGFETTARALYGALRSRPGTVLLTGSRAIGAGRPIARAEMLGILSEPADHAAATHRSARRFDVRLVIATDVLSEGANLQRASVIVHLDDPWTPAAVAQRVGRAARLGSMHGSVFVYRIAPPRPAEDLLALDRVHRTKRAAASRALMPGETMELLRMSVRDWRSIRRGGGRGVRAACDATVDGFLAAITDGAQARLIGSRRRRRGGWVATDDPATMLLLARAVRREERSPPSPAEIAAVGKAITHFAGREAAHRRSGADRHASPARRQILSRLDEIVASASPALRPRLAARTSAIRAMLAGVGGAGAERWFRDVVAHPPDASRWLDDVEQALRSVPQRGRAAAASSELIAVLILRRDIRAPAATGSEGGRPTVAAKPAPSPVP